MAELGIISGSEVSTPSAAIQIDAAPFRAAALAKGQGKARVAQAVGQDLGGLGFDVSQQFQQNRNLQTIFKADIAMRKTKQAFDDWQATHPDPHTWKDQYQQMSQATVDSIMSGPDVGPDVKRHLEKMTQNWQVQTGGEVNTSAQLKTVADTRTAGIQAGTLQAQQGQLDAADKSADLLVSAGSMDPQEAATLKASFRPVAEKAQIANAEITNPWQAIQDLKGNTMWPSISGDTRKAELISAQRILNTQMTQTHQEIVNQRINGKIWEKSELDALVADHKLAPETEEGILKSQAAASYKDDDDQRKLIMYQAGAPEQWKADPDGALKDYTAQAAQIKNPEIAAHLMETLTREHDAYKKTGESAQKPLERQALESLKADPLNMAARDIKSLTEKLGDDYMMSDADVKAEYDGKTRDEVVRSLQMEQADQRDRLHQLFQQHESDHDGRGPTEKEAEAYRQQVVMQPHIDKAAAQTLGFPVNQEGLSKIQDNVAAGKPWYEGSQQPVRVKNQSGQVGTIPAANLKKALAAGYTIVQ